MQRIANAAYLSDILCSGLLRVAPYCVPSGIRVVSARCESGTLWCLISQTPSDPISTVTLLVIAYAN
jgi:hypothetical protein